MWQYLGVMMALLLAMVVTVCPDAAPAIYFWC
jgi:hypothetical protein